MDELPELVNILKGEMSFVGPRPLLMKFLELDSTEQRKRHEVRPGLTGLVQVNGRNSISWKEKFQLDVSYVDNITFIRDVKILTATIKKVMAREGLTSEADVTMEEFEGYTTL